ncbi:MAG: hypothetical protein ACE5HS_12505, partial [bacterium]
MNNRLQKLILNPAVILNNRSNGKHNGHMEINTNQPTQKTILNLFRFFKYSKPAWLDYQIWRKEPLKAFNRLLFIFALFATVAMPFLLMRETSVFSTELPNPVKMSDNEKRFSQTSQNESNTFAQLDVNRRYFRTNVRESVATAVDP